MALRSTASFRENGKVCRRPWIVFPLGLLLILAFLVMRERARP